jgi:photosystem II stability/assembly factor-like uncharacterized protein
MKSLTKFLTFIIFLTSAAAVYSQATALDEHSIKFENSTTATLVGQDGLIMKTTDNGLTWTQKSSNISNTLYGVSTLGTIAIASGETGVVLRTTDNGDNWETVLLPTTEDMKDAEIIAGTRAIVCGNNGQIFLSDDAGLNWSNISSGTSNNLTDVLFINSDRGFIVGSAGTLLTTSDGGSNWASIDLGFTNRDLNGIGSIDENNIFIIGNSGALYISNDAGETWYGQMGFTYDNNFNDIVFFDALNGAIAADDGLLLYTSDGGQSWYPGETSSIRSGYDFYSLAFSDVNNGISIGTQGVDVYTTDGGRTWSETVPAMMPTASDKEDKKVILNQNYPNPFNPATKIDFTMPSNGFVNLKVYDIAGKEVASLADGYKTAGNYSVSFNGSNLSSGVYLYTLTINTGNTNYRKVMKMILTK